MRHISKAINAHSYLLPESLQVSSNKGSRKEESPQFLAETELASHRRHVSVHESFSYLIHSRLQLEGFLDAIHSTGTQSLAAAPEGRRPRNTPQNMLLCSIEPNPFESSSMFLKTFSCCIFFGSFTVNGFVQHHQF